MSEYRITTDLFLLPDESGRNVLYAPLDGFVCLANDDMVGLLGDLETVRSNELSSAQQQIIDFLIQRNIINGAQKRPDREQPEGLSPSKLTLFPTDQCNLKCLYCYASEMSTLHQIMDWETAASAVEYYLAYLKRKGERVFDLEFHGGGEPFLAWNLIQRIAEYAREKCSQQSLDLKICASTNGMLGERQLQWITDTFDSLVVSFDVLPRIQERHRPGKDKRSSFDTVHKTLKYLDDRNFRYGIRCTVSSYNLEMLEESQEFLLQNYNCKLLYLEPVGACGSRTAFDRSLIPDLHRFVEIYKTLEPSAANRGLSLRYSGARFEKLSPHFCYVGTDDFAVTVDGYLTNCWQITSLKDPRSSTFIFGRVLPGGNITYDAEKLSYLRSLSVKNFSFCADCFAQWHCAGDCLMKLGHDDFAGERAQTRCETNRQLISYRISRLLEKDNYFEKV